MSDSNLSISFDFLGDEIRTAGTWDTPLFLAADVCSVLQIKNVADACKDLLPDEKGIVSTDTLGGTQGALYVSESGLYALVMKSRKPQAQGFRRWITSEVIPSIRKTGRYETPQVQQPQQRQLAPQRDLLDYANMAERLGLDQDPLIRSLLAQRLAEELGGKTLATAQVILTVRAIELGVSQGKIGTGSQLGKYIKSMGFEPSGKTQHGKYPVNVYLLSDELDHAILGFFCED